MNIKKKVLEMRFVNVVVIDVVFLFGCYVFEFKWNVIVRIWWRGGVRWWLGKLFLWGWYDKFVELCVFFVFCEFEDRLNSDFLKFLNWVKGRDRLIVIEKKICLDVLGMVMNVCFKLILFFVNMEFGKVMEGWVVFCVEVEYGLVVKGR